MTTGWLFDHIKELFYFRRDNVLWLYIFESLKRQYSNINEINYVRSGIGFKIIFWGGSRWHTGKTRLSMSQ